jgi:hypothetical protein
VISLHPEKIRIITLEYFRTPQSRNNKADHLKGGAGKGKIYGKEKNSDFQIISNYVRRKK